MSYLNFKALCLMILCELVIGCQSSEESMIRSGSFHNCIGTTVERMTNGFFGSPSWTTLRAEDGNTYVNITGEMFFQEKPVEGLLQFFINTDTGEFQVNAFEMNGIAQNGFMLNALLTKLCEAGGGSSRQ